MTYNNARRIETLRRLGVEQLPVLSVEQPYEDMCLPPRGDLTMRELPLRAVPVPGHRCPGCLSRGQTIWVIPGKRCPQCGTEVN